MTRENVNAKGRGMIFTDVSEVHRAYANKVVDLHAKVKVRIKTSTQNEDGTFTEQTTIVDTTVGRSLLSELLPEGLSFDNVNCNMTKKAISACINTSYRQGGLKKTVVLADRMMYMGFSYATRSGISIGVNDMVVPEEKAAILEAAEIEVHEIQDQYASGLVTNGERYNKVVDIWSRTNDQVAKAMMDNLGIEMVETEDGKMVEQASFNSIFMMADSGARGSAAQIRQLSGMRAVLARPDGSFI